jgi:oligopeptide transport system permease protein
MTQAEAAGVFDELADYSPRAQRGLWGDAWRRLRRNKLAMVAIVVLLLIITLAVLGNYVDAVQRYDPRVQEFESFQRPNRDHFFGTDNLGRDSWSRVLQGTLISLMVGLGVAAIVLVIGVSIGALAALGGRTTDNLVMRVTDIAYAFPDLLFIILMGAALEGRNWPIVKEPVVQMIIAISFVGWVTVARLVRGQMLSIRNRDYVIAAEAMGASPWRIVRVHMLPNTLGPVIVAVIFVIPLAIFAEAALGFIGLGIPPPTASLGRLVSEGYRYIERDYWMVIIPAGIIALLMLCFTFLGDGLRDALDPRH